ncbi:hypothetical protein ALP8811_00196 [Aliiroseovarius pelagivivens]|uniref:Outer membrane protein beta-barrel domain-containing protein n=1 Tax=Aliiroseovarius pelagivivens TaxID=1639690 RepID=A0A2R8AGM2_9RHOB|nr:outer membrane beta-barrel protein [Aliiroseovarius pelagivivens]SPF75211.1 hypothetical protein ALP8811_00196 [Aliiroseovarius pelagivivens]
MQATREIRPSKKATIAGAAILTSLALSASAALADDLSGSYIGLSIASTSSTAYDISYGDEGDGAFDMNGARLGLVLGRNWQTNNVVYGGELEIGFGNASGTDNAYMLPLNEKTSLSLRLRAGLQLDKILPFVSMGYTATALDASHDPSGFEVASASVSGLSYGIGAEYQVSDTGSVRFMVEKINYSDDEFGFFDGSDVHEISYETTSISLGFIQRF